MKIRQMQNARDSNSPVGRELYIVSSQIQVLTKVLIVVNMSEELT